MSCHAMKIGLRGICVLAAACLVTVGGGVVDADPEEAVVSGEEAKPRDYSDFRYGLTVFEYEQMVEQLGLDAGQASLVEAMHDELRRERNAAEQESLSAREDLEAWRRSMQDGTGPDDRRERLRGYTQIVERINSSHRLIIASDIARARRFFADLRLVLRADQVESLDAALR